MQRKRSPHALLVGMQIGVASTENNVETPQKPKNKTAIQSSNSIPG